jgi:glycosyltransferase involved in cell wall biosynthesis
MTQKVSIIIPVYNGANFISDAFNALSKQSYGNFEVVFVVDKKTTDNSLEVIEKEKTKLADVKVVIQEEDTKLGGARNDGLKRSDGEIIWFMDVDDIPTPDLLDYTVSVMEAFNADTVMFNSIRTNSRSVDIHEKNYIVDVLTRKEAINALLYLRLPVTAWSKIIRRKVLIDNNIEFSHGYAEDVEQVYHVVDKSDTVCFCEKPMYIYVQNEGSICNSGKQRNARGRAEIAVYGRLEEYFSEDAEVNDRFRKRSALMRIRSSVHMEKESFMEYAKSEECRAMLKKDLRGSLSPEAALFKAAPSVYYRSVDFYLRKIYYKNNTYFRKPKRTRSS